MRFRHIFERPKLPPWIFDFSLEILTLIVRLPFMVWWIIARQTHASKIRYLTLSSLTCYTKIETFILAVLLCLTNWKISYFSFATFIISMFCAVVTYPHFTLAHFQWIFKVRLFDNKLHFAAHCQINIEQNATLSRFQLSCMTQKMPCTWPSTMITGFRLCFNYHSGNGGWCYFSIRLIEVRSGKWNCRRRGHIRYKEWADLLKCSIICVHWLEFITTLLYYK